MCTLHCTNACKIANKIRLKLQFSILCYLFIYINIYIHHSKCSPEWLTIQTPENSTRVIQSNLILATKCLTVQYNESPVPPTPICTSDGSHCLSSQASTVKTSSNKESTFRTRFPTLHESHPANFHLYFSHALSKSLLGDYLNRDRKLSINIFIFFSPFFSNTAGFILSPCA